MSRRPTVLVTGGIGSGKSAVCALLSAQGVPVYDCDARTKSLYGRHPELVAGLEKSLGVPLRMDNGRLDRSVLAARVFSTGKDRLQVEALVYPALLQDFKRWRARQKGAPFVVMESAVLLSKPLFDGLASVVILVTAPRALRLQRVQERDGLSASAVRSRMAAQPEIPVSAATFVIENDGSPEKLERAVNSIIKTLQI